jgi:stage III sporulation protein AH
LPVVIVRTDRRTRFLIFVILVALALLVVVAAWPSPKPAATPVKPVAAPAAATAVPAAPPSSNGYFVTARLDQARAESRELALDQPVAADASASAAVRAEAQAQELALARQQGQEAEIRAVLLAKGYPDALVYLTGQPASAVVVLEARTLTEDDAARAADAVERVAGVPEGDISVMAHR